MGHLPAPHHQQAPAGAPNRTSSITTRFRIGAGHLAFGASNAPQITTAASGGPWPAVTPRCRHRLGSKDRPGKDARRAIGAWTMPGDGLQGRTFGAPDGGRDAAYLLPIAAIRCDRTIHDELRSPEGRLVIPSGHSSSRHAPGQDRTGRTPRPTWAARMRPDLTRRTARFPLVIGRSSVRIRPRALFPQVRGSM